MDLRQLKQFVVLAEELHFRRAAQRLHMTQPPLSAAIRRLEDDVGTPLFTRSRTQVELTPAGTAFLREVRHLLTQAELSLDVARSAAQGSAGVLRVSCVESAAFEFMPAVLTRFRAQWPNARLVLTTDSSHNEINALKNGLVEAAILVPAAAEVHGLTVTQLRQERFCLAVSSRHALAGERCVKLSAVAGEPLVALYPFASSPGYSSALLDAFHKAQVYPRVHQSGSQIFTNLMLVGAGIGVALLPRPMRNIRVDNVSVIDVVAEDGAPLPYAIALARRAGCDSALAQSFEELAVAVAHEQAAAGATDQRVAAGLTPVMAGVRSRIKSMKSRSRAG